MKKKRNLKQHLAWTVKFQVAGKTFSELAREANVEQTTVSRAVREILKYPSFNQKTKGFQYLSAERYDIPRPLLVRT